MLGPVPVTFTKLAKFPRNRLLDVDLVRCRADELDLLGAFGPPTLETAASEPDPIFYWDLDWTCGLVMSLKFEQLTQTLTLRMDEPDTNHALRHLGFDVASLWTLEDADPNALTRVTAMLDTTWDLFEVNAKGTRTRIDVGLTERDARCRAGDFDAGGPNPAYAAMRSTAA